MSKKLYTLITVFLFLSFSSKAQIQINAVNNNSAFITCYDTLFDSGGPSTYGNNENYTVTICPDTITSGDNTDYIKIKFNDFNLDNLDQLYLYDGVSTSSPSLGNYTQAGLNGVTISATNANTSGCITLTFVSNAINNPGNWGFSAVVGCAKTCFNEPTAVAQFLNAPTLDTLQVCLGEQVQFYGNNSISNSGYTLTNYSWNFGSVIIDSLNPFINYTFNQPGIYNVVLRVSDSNPVSNCFQEDILTVQITPPPSYFEFPIDTILCIGDSLDLIAQPSLFDNIWSNTSQNFDVDACIGDDQLGGTQSIPLIITDANPIQITDVNQIEGICMSIEHSYSSDLIIEVICPSGQSAILFQQGTGGLQLGIPDQSDNCSVLSNTGIGEHYNYCFTPSATENWVEWVNLNGNGLTLPAGNYEPVESLDALLGCPLNGIWNLQFTDVWGGDDGSISSWGITFVDSLYTNLTNYQSTTGTSIDSSYWQTNNPLITTISSDGNTASVIPNSSGTFDYTYYTIDNYGCSFDSTITILVNPPLIISAGLDTLACLGQEIIIGNSIISQCSNDANNYNFCYSNNQDTTFTYCPNTPNNGLTFMEIIFNSGSIEQSFDQLKVYDGIDNTGTLIGSYDGDLSGLNFTATNLTGCITFVITSDGSSSCASGSQIPLDYDVSCSNGINVYSWLPDDGSLDNVNIANPTILNPSTTEVYSLSAYPIGHPNCVVYDSITISTVDINSGLDSVVSIFPSSQVDDLINYLGGSPQTIGEWNNPIGQAIAMPVLFDTLSGGIYEYSIDSVGCTSTTYLDVTIIQIDTSTTLTNVNNIIATADNVQYQWLDCNLGYSEILGETNKTFIALNNGSYAVEITQNQHKDTSSCVHIYELNLPNNSQQDVIISPNPTSGNINITLENLTNVTVNIISSEGKLIYTKDNINTEQLLLNLELKSGLYFIQIKTEGSTEQYKLIKN